MAKAQNTVKTAKKHTNPIFLCVSQEKPNNYKINRQF